MNETITRIIEAAEEKGFTCFGVRKHHEIVTVGDSLGFSTNYIDDQEPEELPGICCIITSYDGFEVEDFEGDLAQLEQYSYNDGSTILVGGRGFEYGNDQNEIIIENATVLWVK
jgi:hypothetical protein